MLPSADVAAAAATAVRARINNNGQSCIAGKRFIVHTDVYDDFAAEFTQPDGGPRGRRPAGSARPRSVRSPPSRAATISSNWSRTPAPEAPASSPADPCRTRPGWYYAPTVIADLPDDARLVQEETFGPVASLYRAKDNEDALRIANQTTFGLSSCGLDQRPDRGGVVRREPRRRRRVHQRDDRLLPGAARSVASSAPASGVSSPPSGSASSAT